MLTRQRARRTADRAGARAATRSSRRCPRRPSARRRRPREMRRSPIRLSPCRLPTFVCSSSLDADRRSRSSGWQRTVRPSRTNALRSACSSTPTVVSGSAATRWRTIFSAIWNAELDEVALARCERLLARVARACDELLGECEPLDDGRLGACRCRRRSRPRSPARARPARSPRPARARRRSALRPARARARGTGSSRRGCACRSHRRLPSPCRRRCRPRW